MRPRLGCGPGQGVQTCGNRFVGPESQRIALASARQQVAPALGNRPRQAAVRRIMGTSDSQPAGQVCAG